MKVKNIVRKAVALGSGAALVGTTLMGALAYDLSTYPAKFIVDGKFDGKIVVGEKAATTDVLGSIDIAASLQAGSVSKVALPGQAGSVSLEGDVFALETGSDKVELREPIGDVVDTVTASDLAGLKSGKITTSQGSTDYHQYLRLKDGANLQNMTVNFVENDDDVMKDYLVVDTDLPFLEWEIQFPEGLEGEVESNGDLDDLEDRSFNMLGTDFSIVTATLTNGDDLELTLMGGSVPDTLREGETKTYTINGVDYETTLVFVSDPSSGSSSVEAKFSVNGELTKALNEGDTDTLSGGLQIGVRDILVNAREGVASFFLGADKVVFTDTSATVSDDFSGTVEINNENINDGDVTLLGANTSATKFEITSIKYRLTMDAADGTTAFVPKGHGVKEFMKRPEALISDSLDIRYEGLTTPETKDVKVKAKGDDEYELTFTNTQGQTYKLPLLTNKDGVWKFGDNDDDLVFIESGAITTQNIGTDDYFILSNDRGSGDADKSVTNVLRYEDYDSTDFTLEFEDLSSGATITVPVATSGVGSLVVGGHTYQVNVSLRTSPAPNLSIDLNADGDYTDGLINVTTWGGAVLNLLQEAQINGSISLTGAGNVTQLRTDAIGNGNTLEDQAAEGTAQYVNMTLSVLAKNFDTTDQGAEKISWTISEVASGNEVDIAIAAANYIGPLEDDSPGVEADFQFQEDSDNDERNIGMTDFGIFVDETNPSGSSEPNELTFSIPKTQIFGQVFVTLGAVSSTESSSGTADKVNPIAVGLAVLDRDAPAVGSDNLIVVGGPCANTVAAELLGNPAECAEGFEEGKAMIQSSEKNGRVAILVAGYSAQDTLGASRVLAAYKDYALNGAGVEVVVADLNSIQVKSMS